MTRKRQRRRRLFIFLTILFLLVCLALYFFVFKYSEKTSYKVLDEIKEYGYTLEKRDTELMENEFKLLKEELSKTDIDYEKYATQLAKLYIIDLYTINNKNSKYDVGGGQYVYPDHKENYEIKVQDTLYKYVQEKSNRKQKLPEVVSIDIKDINATKFKYQDKEYDAYEMNASWDYKKDYDYDTEAKITVVKIDNKMYIASLENNKEAS